MKFVVIEENLWRKLETEAKKRGITAKQALAEALEDFIRLKTRGAVRMAKIHSPKPCRCKICGKHFPEIGMGRAHLVVKHGKTWNAARNFLRMGGAVGDE